jgi:hypothetical protein
VAVSLVFGPTKPRVTLCHTCRTPDTVPSGLAGYLPTSPPVGDATVLGDGAADSDGAATVLGDSVGLRSLPATNTCNVRATDYS